MASAVFVAGAVTAIRVLRATDNAPTIFFAFCLGGIAVSWPFALGPWPTDIRIWGIALLGVGGASFVAQMLMTHAYGALSVPAGRVDVRWRVDREDGRDDSPGVFVLSWDETGGPVVVVPTRTGYGRKIIEDTMRRIGKHHIDYAQAGLKYRMEAPIEKVGWIIDEKPAL